MRWQLRAAILAVAVVSAAMGPAGAAPDEDGQPPQAPSRYDAGAPTGWMTSAAADRVQDLAQIGDTVYVAGSYAGIRPTRTGPVTDQAWLAAFDAVTGAPRPAFAPALNGVVYSLEPSPDGSRLYVAGAFTSVNGASHNRVVALNPVTGATVPGFTPNIGGGTVRSIVLRGTTLYVGGNFSSASGQTRSRLVALDTVSGQPRAGWVPSAAGGTVLTLEMAPDGSRLYVGGRFSSVDGRAATAHLAAVDPVTGGVAAAFAAQPGREVFDVLADDRGLVWTALGGVLGRADVYRAGDGSLLTRHETSGDVQAVEEVGDLIYFGGHDIGYSENEHVGVVDPVAPAIMETEPFDEPTTGGDGNWALHSTGRDLWVGGNVGNPYFGFARYPAVLDPPARVELLPVLSDWRYLDTAAAPAGWRAPGFADGSWATGAAELGFGDGGEATVLASGRTTYYFRRTFSVSDVPTLTDLRLDLLADDGAAVFVNGTEVARTNLPAGDPTDGTRAVAGLSGNPEDTFLSYSVPPAALVEGANTIAVEVHQTAAASSDLSFDARLSAVRDVPDTQAPTVPTGVVADLVTEQSVILSWAPADDDVAVDHYDVFQDGVLVASIAGTTAVIGDLAASSTYAFTVEAVDRAGNRSGPSAALDVTTPDPAPGGPIEPVARGAVWRFRDDGWAGGDGSWRGLGFDDGGWSQGPAELGREDGDEATVLNGRHPDNSYIVTHWFRRGFTISGVGSIQDLRLELLADDGAVAYVNGTEVARDNMPTGAVGASTTASGYRTGAAEQAWSTFALNPGVLVEGENVVAVEVHQAAGSADVSFDARLSGTSGAPDTSAPSVPTGLTSPGQTDTTVDLTWSAATDDVGVARYEVFLDGAPVGTSMTTAFTVAGLTASSSYGVEVEALDAAGNRSGRSDPLAVQTAAAAAGPVEVVARGAVWRYRNAGAAPPSNWADGGFDDSAWDQGPAVLGREEGGEGTVLTPGSGVRWFRRTFAVGAASEVTALDLDLVADDGAVVFLNGVEVLRDNLPTGPLSDTTPAAGYRTGAAELAARSFSLPPAALVDGVNVLAVRLHQAPGSSDASFDARLVAAGTTADVTAPTIPTGLTSPARTATTVDLAWAAASDDIAVAGYEVVVDGAVAGVTPTTSLTLSALTPSTDYSVAVEAVDAAGNRSGLSAPIVVTTAAASAGPVELVAIGATWRYRNVGTAPAADWYQPVFDDSGWLSGAAKLGREEGDEATVLTPGSGVRWFRHRFTATDAAGVTALFIDLVADDGAVVYLNGTEVVRDNLPAGALTDSTLAVSYRTGSAEATRRTFSLPTSALVEGENVIAVALYQAAGSADASFAARLRTEV